MYLMDSSASTVNNRKWNLGRLGNGVLNMPVVPGGAQNPSPVFGSASNGGITTVMATRPSTNPLDYTSPQAAIAAGLDPPTVYSKWTAALAKFPSPQAAIAAGVPAGVVNQLWQQSYQNAENKAAKNRGMGRLGLQPVRLPNLGRLGASSTAQGWRMRGLRFFGDDLTPPDFFGGANPIPGSDQEIPVSIPGPTPPSLPPGIFSPSKPNIPVSTQTSLPPAPTISVAPGGIVTAIPVRVASPAAPVGASGGTIFGLSPTTLLYAGAALFGLAALGGGGRRR